MFNRLISIILVYIVLYSLIVYIKPEIIYENRTDSLREFGVGYKKTTVLPLWLTSILLAIISYFIVLYFMHIRYNCIFINC
jgi:hypothetical protein